MGKKVEGGGKDQGESKSSPQSCWVDCDGVGAQSQRKAQCRVLPVFGERGGNTGTNSGVGRGKREWMSPYHGE